MPAHLTGDRVGYLKGYPNKGDLPHNSTDRELNVLGSEVYWIDRLDAWLKHRGKEKPKDSINLTDVDGKRIITNNMGDTVWNVYMDKPSNSIFYTLHNSLFQSDLAGNNPKKLIDGVKEYQYSDGWVYFDRDGKLIRFETASGKEEEVMSLSGIKSYNVNGTYVYYTEGANVFRQKLGSTDAPKQLNVTSTNSVEDLAVLPSGVYLYNNLGPIHLTFEGHFISLRSLEKIDVTKKR